MMLFALLVTVWTVESAEKLFLPSLCVCACSVSEHGWSWGCGVSDDTGGVIPPTSASNLQHEKDTLVTPYLPPTILYPHPAPSARRCSLSLSLSFEPKSNSVSGYEKVPTTTCNQTYKGGKYLFILCALIHVSVGQRFHSVWN